MFHHGQGGIGKHPEYLLLSKKKAAVQHRGRIKPSCCSRVFIRTGLEAIEQRLCLNQKISQTARNHFVSEITVEPIIVWAAFGTFVLGVLVGALVVLGELKRARHRRREAMRTWHEIEAVATELRGEHSKLPRHNAPDMVAAIREGVTEQLKKRSAYSGFEEGHEHSVR